MTLRELMMKYVLPCMAEKQSAFANYAETFVGVSNVVLCEIWDLNERLRKKRGRVPVSLGEFAPVSEADELPLEFDLLVNCACWGIAANLLIDEAGDEGAMVGYLADKFREGKARFAQLRPVRVRNIFGR